MVLNGIPYFEINNDIYLRCFLFSSSHTLLFYNLHRYLGFEVKWHIGCMPANQFSHVWLFVILWAVAHQAPFSMGFSGQEYWRGFPCHPSRDLLNPGIEPMSPVVAALQVDSLQLTTEKAPNCVLMPFKTQWAEHNTRARLSEVVLLTYEIFHMKIFS